MHLDTVPTAVGRHDGPDIIRDRLDIAGHVYISELLLGADGVALVIPANGSAVAGKVLGTGDDAFTVHSPGTLQALNKSSREHRCQFGVFAKTLIGPGPIVRHERPPHTARRSTPDRYSGPPWR